MFSRSLLSVSVKNLKKKVVHQHGGPVLIKQIFRHFSFPLVQPPNALSLPNFGSRYIFACSMQNIENITLK